ncbi:MAG: hypothetical protein VR64_08125 [Desulfatitalea sp. BRH_c12]|nr:MAG: hypothetical protein VR64_08125 [Desulfatitalea sp. BRH_c12]
MCLILFAYQRHPNYRLVLAANRDEFYARPTAPLDFWQDHPDVLAGRDLEQGGTWMGVTRSGRLAAITNFREPSGVKSSAPSRGHLVADYLCGDETPQVYLQRIASIADQYNGFNLIVGDQGALCYFSTRSREVVPLRPGLYGLSNHLMDTPWPKVTRGKQKLGAYLQKTATIAAEPLFDLLQNQEIADDDLLPETGIGLDWERVLSPIFISSPGYGTRSSSVLLIDHADGLQLTERTWNPAPGMPRDLFTRHFQIAIHPLNPCESIPQACAAPAVRPS